MTTVLRLLVVGGACALTSIAPLAAQSRDGLSVRPQAVRSDLDGDAEFVKRAAEAGHKEIEAGKLALRQAASAEVRAFADRMVKDHTTVNAELLSLADAPTPMPPDHAASATGVLATQAGAAFDRAYVEQAVTAHELLLTLFEQEAAAGKDARLKLWAEQKLPMLREHLEMARGLAAKVVSNSA